MNIILNYFDDNDYIKLRSKRKGYHDIQTLDIIKEINPIGTYIDIGAYIGSHTIFFGKYCSNCNKIVSFEPRPKAFEYLNKNILSNNINNVEVYNIALGNENAKGNLYVTDAHKQCHNYGATMVIESKNGDISIKTLDEFNLDDISLIKIDAEGNDLNILKGSKATIESNNVEIIIAECWDKKILNDTDIYLKQFGYKLHTYINENGIWLKE